MRISVCIYVGRSKQDNIAWFGGDLRRGSGEATLSSASTEDFIRTSEKPPSVSLKADSANGRAKHIHLTHTASAHIVGFFGSGRCTFWQMPVDSGLLR